MNMEESLRLFSLPNLDGQSEQTLKKRYHLLAQKYHPDKGGSSEEFIALRKAYVYLRTAILDPSNSTHKQREKYYREKRYYDSDSSSSNATSEDSGSTNTETINPYKEAYEKAVDQIRQYEDIFNSQVRIINTTNKHIQQRYTSYSSLRDELKSRLDQNLSQLEKRHYRTWWQHVVPVPKIDRQSYIQQYNELVQTYNATVKDVDEKFMESLLQTYQSGFEQIIDYLK